MDKPIRILIAEREELVRAALQHILHQEPGLEVIGEATDGFEVSKLAATLCPDIILLELALPGRSGLELIPQLKAAALHSRILILTEISAAETVLAAIKLGVAGYLLKTSSSQQLIKAIQAAYYNQAPLDPTLACKLFYKLQIHAELPCPEDELTSREVEILRLMAHGLSNWEIARRLRIAEPTVRTHASKVLQKLHLENRTQATLYALRMGLTHLEDYTLNRQETPVQWMLNERTSKVGSPPHCL